MVKRCILVLSACISGSLCAQDVLPNAGTGLLRASATISPGFLLNLPVTNTYVSGKIEYFIEDRISLRGNALWIVPDGERHRIVQNSQLSFGPSYHIVQGRMDVGLGVEAGINCSRPSQRLVSISEERDPVRIVPNASLCANFTWAVWDYLHFFVDARYVHARYMGSFNGTVPLNEIVLGGGLGWQLRVKK